MKVVNLVKRIFFHHLGANEDLYKKKGLSKNRWGLGVPLRNPGIDDPGGVKEL